MKKKFHFSFTQRNKALFGRFWNAKFAPVRAKSTCYGRRFQINVILYFICLRNYRNALDRCTYPRNVFSMVYRGIKVIAILIYELRSLYYR